MKIPAEPVVPEAHVARSHTIARAAGVTVVVITVMTLCGWLLDVRWLTAFSAATPPIKVNAALAFAALGLAVTLLSGRSPGQRARRWGSALAVAAVAVAVTTLVEYVSGGIPPIDEVLIRDRFAEGHTPGRMAINTAVGVALIGAGLLLRDARPRAARGLGEACLLAAGTVGLLAAVGHLYNVPVLTSTSSGDHRVAISYPGVAAQLTVTMGALAARPRQGVMGVVLGGHAGGVAARRLLPIAVGVPLMLGWLRYVSEQRALVEANLGIAMLVVLTVLCLVAVVILLAGALNQSGVELSHRNALLARSNRALDRANADLTTLAAIVQSSTDAIIAHDLDGKITAWNPAAQGMYGFRSDEVIGTNITLIMASKVAADLPAALARIAHGEHIEHHETTRIHRDGSVLDVSVSIAPVFDETGAVIGVSTIARDVTASKAAEAGMRRLAAIVQSSTDAIIAYDLHGKITAWSSGAEHLYGYTADEAIGRTIDVLTPAEHKATVRELIARIGQGEHVERYEARRVRKDGSMVDVSVGPAPLFDESGKVIGVSAVAHDITDRKAAQAREQLLRERSQSAERLTSLGQLAGGVAHDFNNALAVILNYATFITEQTPAGSPIHDDATKITIAAQRSAALADQMMVFARKEPAKVEIFDLNTTVTEVRHLLERTLGEHIRMITRSSAVPLPVRADSGRIHQVLLNLALNARDAMPEGGTLVIEVNPTDLDDQSMILSLGLNPGRYARLLVSDTGTGMPPAVAARVFEPFFTTKPKGQGTGLGLATAYGTITQLGGSITLHSEPGVGTTMRVHLPLIDQPSTPLPAKSPGEPPQGRGQTILAVDDEAAIRELLARILDANGYTVVVAGSGPQALEMINQHPVDLLLTDVIMPEMNGQELADTLRRRRPDMPVLYISGYSDGLLSAERLLADGVKLIQKPFTSPELLHTVHSLLTQALSDRPI